MMTHFTAAPIARRIMRFGQYPSFACPRTLSVDIGRFGRRQ
jgi:hypothetical protein